MRLFQPATLNRLFKRIKPLNTSGEIRHLSVAEEQGLAGQRRCAEIAVPRDETRRAHRSLPDPSFPSGKLAIIGLPCLPRGKGGERH